MLHCLFTHPPIQVGAMCTTHPPTPNHHMCEVMLTPAQPLPAQVVAVGLSMFAYLTCDQVNTTLQNLYVIQVTSRAVLFCLSPRLSTLVKTMYGFVLVWAGGADVGTYRDCLALHGSQAVEQTGEAGDCVCS